ncbi:hypothetical protein GCM10029963_67650 [Micromonospora andamanensis]
MPVDVIALLRTRAALPTARAVLVWAGVAVLPVLWVMAPAVANSGDGVGVVGWWLPTRYLVPVLIVALPAALLPRHPLTGLGLMLAGATLSSATVHGRHPGYLADLFNLQFLAVDAALAVVAANRSRRVSVSAAGVVLVTQLLVAFVNLGVEPVNQAALTVLAVTAAWIAGNSVRARRNYADALRIHAAIEAVTAERLRIARELHDMVAHSIGVIAIQAGVGARVIDTQPAQARAALATIEAASRDTLAGLRRTLGALRRGDGDPASLEPAPGWRSWTGWSPPPATPVSGSSCVRQATRPSRPRSTSPRSASSRRHSRTWSATPGSTRARSSSSVATTRSRWRSSTTAGAARSASRGMA